jgi:hypothetical protein
MTTPIFLGTISIKSLLRFSGLIIIILVIELVVSVMEWFYLPSGFTGGWYHGSFILFEAESFEMFINITSVLFILWTLIARYNCKAYLQNRS